MWPADAFWDLAVQTLTLGGILLACALARRGTGGIKWRRRRLSLTVEPRAKRFVIVVCLAALFATCGWLGQVATLGVAQTLAMALGGPSAEDIDYCRQLLARADRTGPPPKCVFGGKVSALPAGGWTCDKHGPAVGRTP
jgi:hypothetical protein